MPDARQVSASRISLFHTVIGWTLGIPWTALMAGLSVIAPLFPKPALMIHLYAKVWGEFLLFITGVTVDVSGLENIPLDRSVLVVSNHQSLYDIVVFVSCIPLRIAWIAKRELFRIPIFGTALYAAGYIPMDRGEKEKAYAALQKAAECLKNRSVVIFPEGTRTRTGRVGRFKGGAAFLAHTAGASILPVTITNSFERVPPEKKGISPGVIHVIIDPLISTENMKRSEIAKKLEEIQHIAAARVDASYALES